MSVFKMLVVDDEELIANGLYEVFRSQDDLELDVYKAYSAQEALRLLRTVRVDVVLSDIHMPGMNGLELLVEIRKLWPKCRVVFLTGYDEFEYVYTAIRYTGVSYLLKTDSYDEVVAAVKKAVSDLDDELKADALVQAANERMAEARGLMRENFLSGILDGRYGLGDMDQTQLDELGSPLRIGEPVFLMAGRAENLPRRLRYSEKCRRLYEIRAVVDHYLEPFAVSACVPDEAARLFWFIQRKPSSSSGTVGEAAEAAGTATSAEVPFASYVKENAVLIQDAASRSLGMVLSFAVEGAGDDRLSLCDRADGLKMALNYRIGRESGLLLMDKTAFEGRGAKSGARLPGTSSTPLLGNRSAPDLKSEDDASPRAASVRFAASRLAEYLDGGSREDFFTCLAEIAPASSADIHDLRTVERYQAVALVFLSHINRWAVAEKTAAHIGLHKLTAVESHASCAEAVAYLKRLAEVLFDVQEADSVSRAVDAVDLVRAHIRENIRNADELTLTGLADLVHFNPSYLSRLFKQVAHVNLSDYIAELRILEAERLLEDPSVRICEVAERLGYCTATNFTRFFKKYTNLTPIEYRERAARGSKELN